MQTEIKKLIFKFKSEYHHLFHQRLYNQRILQNMLTKTVVKLHGLGILGSLLALLRALPFIFQFNHSDVLLLK